KPNGPKSSSKSSSSAQKEIKIEIVRLLEGMLRQPQGPSKQKILANESREANKYGANCQTHSLLNNLKLTLHITPVFISSASES
ncbi:Protein TIME FOR COFFEE, partial [Fagus crenata]